ncbi:MAG TPA: hypothetical protein VG603_03930 [Chitinophagales bacterium]|nr:hypothetical protein [Chitinophagales bacterium]
MIKKIPLSLLLICLGFLRCFCEDPAMAACQKEQVAVPPPPPAVTAVHYATRVKSTTANALHIAGLKLNTASNTTGIENMPGIQAKPLNTYHNHKLDPFADGAIIKSAFRYSALSSVCCVWDISWGLQAVNSTQAPGNHLNIMLTISNPMPSGKTENPFIQKLNTNLPLSYFSAVELIVTL